MDAQKVDMFIVTNGKFFRPEIVPQIKMGNATNDTV